jgi:uncharacterized protein YigE (DUF2233 family)
MKFNVTERKWVSLREPRFWLNKMPLLWAFGAFAALLLLFSSSNQELAAQQGGVSLHHVEYGWKQFDVIHINTQDASLRLFWRKPGGGPFGGFADLEKWLSRNGERLLFAMNAGAFGPDFRPAGLHIEQGREQSPLLRALGSAGGGPSGVFYIGARGPRIVPDADYNESPGSVRLATQSGPLLLHNGLVEPGLNRNSDDRRIRSGVGITAASEIYFVLSREPVTNHELASLFRDNLNCTDALCLDGEISSFYMPGATQKPAPRQYAGMLAVVAEPSPGIQQSRGEEAAPRVTRFN